MMVQQKNNDSRNVMHHIKPDTVGAEIGVWYGNTSSQFLKRGIKKLHLVDSWSTEPYKGDVGEHGSYEAYLKKYSTKLQILPTDDSFGIHYNKVYNTVKEKFAGDDRVEIHRMTSDEWFENYSGEKLDWIYIDGAHSFEGCYADLNNALQIVKSGGKIMGDDYYWPFAKWGKKGVTQAVDKFLLENSFEKTREGMTQFVIEV